MKKAIAYHRVSTIRQGQSGLGLEAQQKAVHDFANRNGYKLLEEFIEVESGRRDNRPVLKTALSKCNSVNAVLLIACLDRLARNVVFIATLLQSKVHFIAVDNPHANKFMTHIMAAVSEYEREAISQRTTLALKAAKERGIELGKHGKYVLSKKNKKAADDFALKMQPVFEQLKQKGFKTIRGLAHELNRQKIKTFTGGTAKWHTLTVYTITKRIEKLSSHLS